MHLDSDRVTQGLDIEWVGIKLRKIKLVVDMYSMKFWHFKVKICFDFRMRSENVVGSRWGRNWK